jgi:hypothetical protein
VINALVPLQERMDAITDTEVIEILQAGAQRAENIAEAKIRDVKAKVGFVV